MFGRVGLWVFALLLGAGCGSQTVYRPVELNLVGLSGRAERLVVLMFPEEAGQTCVNVELGNVASLTSVFEVIWSRSESEDIRQLALPEVESFAVTLVAYAEDDGGTPIQFGCTTFDYTQIESPNVTLQLSARVQGG